MSFIQDKSDIFSEIAVSKAIEDNFPKLSKSEVSFNSIKSAEGNLIPFFLDLLKNLVDSATVKNELQRFITKVDAFEERVKKRVVESISEKFPFTGKTSNFLSSYSGNTILEIPIKWLDLNDNLKISADTQIGSFYYGPQNADFNRTLTEAIQDGYSSWFGLIDLQSPDKENVKVNINPNYFQKEFKTFIKDSVNSVRIFQPSLLLSKVIDNTYGSVSSLSEGGYEYLLAQIRAGKMVEKVINKETINIGGPTTYDNSFFQFSKKELDDIKTKVDSIFNGSNAADLGCGFGESFIDLNSFSNSFNGLNDLRPSLVKQSIVTFTDNLLQQSTVNISDVDKNNVEYNIISEIFKNMPSIMFSMFANSFMVMIFQMVQVILTGNPINLDANNLEESKVEKFIKFFKQPIVCIINEIYILIIEFLFDLVKAQIIKLAAKQLAKILDDQSKNYRLILKTAKNLLENINITSLITGQ